MLPVSHHLQRERCERPLEDLGLVGHSHERLVLDARLRRRPIRFHTGTGNFEGANHMQRELIEVLPGLAGALQFQL